MADNKQLVAEILKAVGGKENVTAAAHCMTRLRLNLKDDTIPNEDEIKNISGVLGMVKAGAQVQIILGPKVAKVYTEFCQLADLEVQKADDENLDKPKEKLTPKKIGSDILNYVSGSVVPLLPIMIGAGLCKALVTLLGPDMLNIIAADSHTAILLNLMYDSFFYYFPILAGFNAAKKLNIPAPLGAYMGGVLLAPALLEMVNAGTPFTILGINVTMVDYSQSLVPILLSVAFMAFLYRAVAKIMPDAVTTIFTPFITFIVSVPVSLIALAPLGTIIANAIAGGIATFSSATGIIGTALVGALWPFLVMTGMHIAVSMAFIVDVIEKGYMTGPAICGIPSNFAVWGVAVGAFLRLKNKKAKADAAGFAISGIIGGITEPTLYGLCMKYRRCFISMVIGSATGAAYAYITNVAYYMMAGASNFLVVMGFTGGESAANLVNGCIACVLAFVVAVVATYFIGFSKEELEI